MISPNRDLTVDAAKAIAIIAVVLGHVIQGVAASGIIDGDSDAYAMANRFLYLFHMPVFAFLTALFVSRAAQRDGTARYFRSRVVTLVYLYVLWSLLQGTVRMLTGSLVNYPTSPLEIVQLWAPEGQLWFLAWLIVMTTAAVIVQPWRSRTRAVLALALAGLVSLALWGIPFSYFGTQGLGLSVYFIAGTVWGAPRFTAQVQAVPTIVCWIGAVAGWALVAALVVVTRATPPTIEGDFRTAGSTAFGVVGSLAGVVAVIATSRLLSRAGPAAGWLALVGTRTLEIFLAHILATSGTRIVLSLAGVDDPAVHIVAGTIAGVGLPLLLWAVCARLRFPWLFAAPRALVGRPAPRSETERLRAA
ncbi:acyltransferase family protein [Leifsonia sp. Leaf336]|uniref:acyltransferase family protein n=1 Tax=Leifsonia sp. Leaf336 TaxID=1736341 RepID=UPI00138F02FC|nr:acyltransferase [Leifsonia sp. Leaf336]